MSSLIKKEAEWLRTVILPEILKNGRLIDNYKKVQENTFKVGAIDIKVIGTEEAFMLTQCYRATVNFEYATEQQQKKLVVKKTPAMPQDIYDAVNFDALFSNEIDFYTEILPEIQKIAGGKFAAPKYFHSERATGSAMIILEDFGGNGWTVAKDLVGLSLEHARQAVRYLGRFHGFGYALKDNNNERFTQLIARLREPRYASEIEHQDWALQTKCGVDRALKATREYEPEVTEDFLNKWKKMAENYVHYGRQRVAPREPLATLCHGDFLRNNVAFKYENGGAEPLEVMMFDYQTLRYSSPMIDFATFLGLSIYAEVRQKHFDTIFDDYCSALAESYEKNSQKSLPEFLRRETLIKEYIRFMPYSASICSHFLKSLVDPPNISPQEMFSVQRTEEEIIDDSMSRGGATVDREISHQMKEMFDLSRKYQVEIDEGITAKE